MLTRSSLIRVPFKSFSKNLLIHWTVGVLVFSSVAFATKVPSKTPGTNSSITSGAKGLVKSKLVLSSGPEQYLFQGFTPNGLEAIQTGQKAFEERTELFEEQLRNLGTVYHAATVARLAKSNMLLYGPPGGAKSAFVDWIFKGEAEPAFVLQVNQMITEQAFTGGLNFEAAKEGRVEYNTEGSLADFSVALIDEMEKGNPAALSALLSLLNERKILAGNKVIEARLETLFASSNANLSELFEQFLENGQASTAPALLNRFQFKAFIYNWLSVDDQMWLDCQRDEMRHLKAMAECEPEALNSRVFESPPQLNWSDLRQLAHTMFKFDKYFFAQYRELMSDMRKKTHTAIRESEARHLENHLTEPFVYFPSADYTERLRLQVPEIILLSAFVDFLGSPLAKDKKFLAGLKGPIELNFMSLWRAHLTLTTLGSGKAMLELNPALSQKIDINFNSSLVAADARDRREELLIQNMSTEQQRFRSSFLEVVGRAQENMKNASHSGGPKNPSQPSFEERLIQFRINK